MADLLRLVGEAQPKEFVGTKRLEEAAGGAVGYTWRNILAGCFRSAPRLLLPPTPA